VTKPHTEVEVTSWQGKRGALGWTALFALVAACADVGGAGPVVQVGVGTDGGTGESDDLDAAVSAPTDEDVRDASVEGSEDPSVDDAGASADLDASAPGEADAGLPDATLASYEGCLPGVYFGTFNGQVGFLSDLFGSLTSSSIEGKIVIRVSLASAGALLVVDEGTVKGSDKDGNPLTAVVSGVLDCATGTLRSGKLSNGHYVRAGNDLSFTGDVNATYTAWPPSLTGTWDTTGGLESGAGVFSALLAAQ